MDETDGGEPIHSISDATLREWSNRLNQIGEDLYLLAADVWQEKRIERIASSAKWLREDVERERKQ